MFKECSTCKFPMPSKDSFALHVDKCNKCYKKARKRKESTANRRKNKSNKTVRYLHCKQ